MTEHELEMGDSPAPKSGPVLEDRSLSLPPVRSPASGLCRATSRSHRGFSRKLQDMIKKRTAFTEEEREAVRRPRGRFEPRNWRQLTERQLGKLTPVERSRYMTYEPLPKAVQEKQLETLKRVRTVKSLQQEQKQGPTLEDLIEMERNSELIGQLKAAEARHRIRLMRMRYERNRAEELHHLIASQPSSIEAVRLKTFIPPYLQPLEAPELLNKQERTRCEAILEDDQGLTINRT